MLFKLPCPWRLAVAAWARMRVLTHVSKSFRAHVYESCIEHISDEEISFYRSHIEWLRDEERM